ncbi:F-box/kelch-repeat protein At1g74510-like isoform X1 [Papaver somniferum]|uniref:F-box/kelch-repeat protein At1g74510-like isoform X1 n=1 Tax=Papaver somniferum TaxID=3469 RepID=UPI000E70384F|nr:F-box/kelch-repeat protein At1g74510-like isoform X1 [Papaver somniferum]XP_026386242.1 F-box/kelch-repeat protein At1g74510-like isoform X1 [Papaver somniferum]
MLESQACLISRALPSSCEQESKWVYMSYRLIEVSNGKRRLDDEGEEELVGERKSLKRLDTHKEEEGADVTQAPNNLSLSLAIRSDEQGDQDLDNTDMNNGNPTDDEGKELQQNIDMHDSHDAEQEDMICVRGVEENEQVVVRMNSLKSSDMQGVEEKNDTAHHQSLSRGDGITGRLNQENQEEANCNLLLEDNQKSKLLWRGESSNGITTSQRDQVTLTLNDLVLSHCTKQIDMNENIFLPRVDQDSLQHQDAPQYQDAPQDQDGGQGHMDSLIHPLDRDISISCLLHCSRSEYNSVASLNRSFRNLVRNGELYRLRRQMGVIEHWVYFSCVALQWEAFDPISRRWMHLPPMQSNGCFVFSDKESLAVGTELLVFGKEITSHIIWRYSILTNSWSSGMEMNAPRCLFGSASLGEIAILAGGCDSRGKVLSSAELYNSETGTWEILPSMNKPRKMCSGVFMDGKFYVIGGRNQDLLTCGEEYNLETRTWREIPNMFPSQNGPAEAPPLVAVVNNELYAADYLENELRKYDKERVCWVTVGRLPERAVSVNGWGLAFRACGKQLIVIGGPRNVAGGIIELNSWIPNDGPPQWNLLATRHTGSFVYNCAVMGC